MSKEVIVNGNTLLNRKRSASPILKTIPDGMYVMDEDGDIMSITDNMPSKFFQFSQLTRDEQIEIIKDCINQTNHKIQLQMEHVEHSIDADGLLHDLEIYHRAMVRFYAKWRGLLSEAKGV